MANWLMELTKLSKTDETALDLLRQLKSASTDEEKEKAKKDGKEYIQAQAEVQQAETGAVRAEATTDTTDNTKPVLDAQAVEEDKDNDIAGDSEPNDVVPQKVVEKKYDMSEPAFNPRLAKMGITREEELFKLGVFVRKLTREEKIAIRRSIYQKKKKYTSTIQDSFKKKQAEARAAKLADPEYQKYVHQQQLVLRIEEALKNHCNMEWMFKNIAGLTPDVLRELIQVPANANRFKTQKEEFIKNFHKKYGLTSEQESL